MVIDLAFSNTFNRNGLCRCRRKILEFLIDRGKIDVNGGRGTTLGDTAAHVLRERVQATVPRLV
ncbi:hypothetical protein PG993_009896 [Apiospora rasikravindrae]|uniref:Uncharacterized protein n=1 Tax=Apiospora rasikravindrae TaxID=990691 RepID=A0ABR1SKP9_9PEZI